MPADEPQPSSGRPHHTDPGPGTTGSHPVAWPAGWSNEETSATPYQQTTGRHDDPSAAGHPRPSYASQSYTEHSYWEAQSSPDGAGSGAARPAGSVPSAGLPAGPSAGDPGTYSRGTNPTDSSTAGGGFGARTYGSSGYGSDGSGSYGSSGSYGDSGSYGSGSYGGSGSYSDSGPYGRSSSYSSPGSYSGSNSYGGPESYSSSGSSSGAGFSAGTSGSGAMTSPSGAFRSVGGALPPGTDPSAGRAVTRWSGALAPAPRTPDHPAAAEIATSPGGSTFDDDRDYPAVLLWTALWYAAVAVIYSVWAMIGSSSTMRGTAFHGMLHDLPYAGGSLLLSLGVAALLHRATLAWRPITAGFAASVVSAGLITLIISSIG